MSALDPAQLLKWIGRQRWYAGRGNEPTGVQEIARTLVGTTERGEQLIAVLAQISYTAGDPHTYFVPVLLAPASAATAGTETAVIARGPDGIAFDAMASERGIRLLMQALHATPQEMTALWLDSNPSHAQQIRVLSGEQSHTSVVLDERYVAKAFRRVLPGDNPEIEIGRALRSVRGARVAPFAGTLRMTTPAGPYDVLAVHQLVTGESGFDLGVADCRAERAGAQGAHFPGASYELGIALGALHDDLIETLGSTVEPDLTQRVADRLHRRLAALSDVPQLDPYRHTAGAMYDQLASEHRSAPVHRIHGDLHLGQALFGPDGWTFLDFEGEPRRPLPERRAFDSPMRDVAGILRSFAYAAAWDGEHNDGWREKNTDLFLEGYRLQRPDAEDSSLLRAFVLDKALYEVGYEAAYRPERIAIPLRTLEQLAGG